MINVRVYNRHSTSRQEPIMSYWLHYIPCTIHAMTNIKLDAGAFIDYYTSALKRGISKALPILLAELKRLTPENTGEMLDSYVVTEPVMVGWVIRAVIENKSWHAIYVEYWTSGLVFNYHKPKWKVFYSWVGNRTFARAVDNVRKKVIAIILAEMK